MSCKAQPNFSPKPPQPLYQHTSLYPRQCCVRASPPLLRKNQVLKLVLVLSPSPFCWEAGSSKTIIYFCQDQPGFLCTE